MPKEIKCSRCGCVKEVVSTWKYKTCPKCLIRKQQKRREEQKKKHPEESALHMDYQKFKEQWHEISGKWPNYDMYTRAQKDAELQQRLRSRGRGRNPYKWSIITNVPLNREYPEDCVKFRRMKLEIIETDFTFIMEHSGCLFCMYWYRLNKDRGNIGVVYAGIDLFHGHENQEEQPTRDEMSEYVQGVEQEFKEDYMRKMSPDDSEQYPELAEEEDEE